MNPAKHDADGAAIYRRLLTYAWPYKWVFVLAVVGMICAALAETSFVALQKPLMDRGFVARDEAFIRYIPLLWIGIFLTRGISEFTDTYCMQWLGRRIILDLRKHMFYRFTRMPARFYDENSSASLVSKLIYDVEQVLGASTTALRILIRDTLLAVALLSWMLHLNVRLTLVFLVIAPIVAWLVSIANKRFRTTSQRIQTTMGGIAHVAKEAFQSHRIVKSFGGHDYEMAAFQRENNRNRQQAMKRAAISAASVPIIMQIVGIAIAFIIYIATSQTGSNVVSPGTFVSYLTAMLMLMAPIKRIAKVNVMIQTGIAAAHSVFHVLDEPIETDHGTKSVGRLTGSIEFNNVGFGYSEQRGEILQDVSFRVEAGQTIALVGSSGSGKSTTVALLLRFYRPQTGEISVDGVPIESVQLEAYRKNISLVTQETTLFDDTIRNNICYGSGDDVTAESINAAARAAHVMDFAEQLPDGLDTRIGEQGSRLSGGQRQRIAIARALFKDAPILVLDEATSALDSESERLVQEAGKRLMQGRTTLVIAHRLSTIEHADKILVFDRGRIVEIGTHAELIERQGVYAVLQRAHGHSPPPIT